MAQHSQLLPNICPRLAPDDVHQEQQLLEGLEGLRRSVAAVLEASARRSSASSAMHLAQAHLLRQGVASATPQQMLSGSVQLVSPLLLSAACGVSGAIVLGPC